MYSRRFSGLGMLRNFASQSRSARLASAEYPASVAGSFTAAAASMSPAKKKKIVRTKRRMRVPPRRGMSGYHSPDDSAGRKKQPSLALARRLDLQAENAELVPDDLSLAHRHHRLARERKVLPAGLFDGLSRDFLNLLAFGSQLLRREAEDPKGRELLGHRSLDLEDESLGAHQVALRVRDLVARGRRCGHAVELVLDLVDRGPGHRVADVRMGLKQSCIAATL